MKIRGLELAGKWTPEEVRELGKILSSMPQAWIEQNARLKSIIRRPVLLNAPPEAPGHSKYEPSTAAIVVFNKGVYHDGQIDHEQFRRSIYHEIAHTVLKGAPSLLDQWSEKTRDDGFVDSYAKTSPEEDFCDTFSEFFIQGKKTRKVVPLKAKFMQNVLDHAQQEKVAMHFIDGFQDELVKTARPSVSKLLQALKRGVNSGGMSSGMKSTAVKGLAAGGAGSAVGVAVGRRKGRKKGYEEGTGDVMSVAQRARVIGRREGVLAYHRALMQHRRKAAKSK